MGLYDSRVELHELQTRHALQLASVRRELELARANALRNEMELQELRPKVPFHDMTSRRFASCRDAVNRTCVCGAARSASSSRR